MVSVCRWKVNVLAQVIFTCLYQHINYHTLTELNTVFLSVVPQ